MSFTWNQLRTETIFVDHYKVERGWHIQRKNPFSSLWYIHKGQVELNVRQGTYLLSPGSVAILPTEIPFEARTPMKIPYARMSLIRFRLWTADQLDWFTLFQLPIKLENEKQAVTEPRFSAHSACF